MNGYKVLDKGLINQYGFKYEIGKTYYLNGKLKYRTNGFHFCKRVEDTFRFISSRDAEIDVVEIEASGNIEEYEDDYYGFYDMYASDIFKIKRIIDREEYIDMIINSNTYDRVKRLIQLLKLNKSEIIKIRNKYNNTLDFYIDYYQDEKQLKLKKEF